MSKHEPYTPRKRRHFSQSQHIMALPVAVFPLLCPVRELDWLPEWDCRPFYTASAVAELGCAFQTDRIADGGLDIWVITHDEPSARVKFVRMNSLRVMQYDIRLQPADDGSPVLVREQRITALNDDGDRHVAALREADFTAMIANIETLLNRYLSAN